MPALLKGSIFLNLGPKSSEILWQYQNAEIASLENVKQFAVKMFNQREKVNNPSTIQTAHHDSHAIGEIVVELHLVWVDGFITTNSTHLR